VTTHGLRKCCDEPVFRKSFKLPDSVDSWAFRDTLLKKYRMVVKVAEKRWFNGIRISPHTFNTEKDIDTAIKAIRAVAWIR
jgi:selenocysteine lyase/cysteine desulfurase